MKKKSIFTAICAGGLGVVLLFDGGNLSDGIRNGLSLCSSSVIPCLFPFMALSVFICKSTAADFFSAAFRPITGLLRLPQSCGGIWLAAAIGGYPAAAKCINDSVIRGGLSPKTAARMLCFCVNAGPPFLISAVGGAMLGSAKAGLLLLAAQTASAFTIAAVTSLFAKSDSSACKNTALQKSSAACVVESVVSAAESCFRMCAFIIIACGLLAICKNGYFFSHLCSSSVTKALFFGFFEVTAGCAACGEISGEASIITAGIISAFSGVSVMLQVAAVTEESKVSLIPFIISRPANAVFTAFILKMLCSLIPESAAAFAVRSGGINAVLSSSAPVAVSLVCMAALFLLSLVPPKSECEPIAKHFWSRIKKLRQKNCG